MNGEWGFLLRNLLELVHYIIEGRLKQNWLQRVGEGGSAAAEMITFSKNFVTQTTAGTLKWETKSNETIPFLICQS